MRREPFPSSSKAVLRQQILDCSWLIRVQGPKANGQTLSMGVPPAPSGGVSSGLSLLGPLLLLPFGSIHLPLASCPQLPGPQSPITLPKSSVFTQDRAI